jgi:tetratricopeptide (TPR) repeat protein
LTAVLDDGDVEAARRILHEGREIGAVPANEPYYVWLAYYDRDPVEMRRLLEIADGPWLDDQFEFAPKALGYARAFALEGDDARARVYYDSARVDLEARIAEDPEDPRYHSALGIGLAGLGRTSEAVRAGERGLRLMPPEREAWRGTARVYDLARIYAATGRHDEAVELLQGLLLRPSSYTTSLLRLDPAWDPLRRHPGFVALVSEGR